MAKQNPRLIGGVATPEFYLPECDGCIYWYGYYGNRHCHYYLLHGPGHRRDGDQTHCNSRDTDRSHLPSAPDYF